MQGPCVPAGQQPHLLLERQAREDKAAVPIFRSFLEQNPDDENVPEARYLLSDSLRRQGQINESLVVALDLLKAESKYTEKDPKRWSYWQRKTGNQLANEFYERGDFGSSLLIYQTLAKLSTEPSWNLPVTYQIGLCLERLQRFDRARECYQTIVDNVKPASTDGAARPELADLAEMAAWRLDQLAWLQDTDKQLSLFFNNGKAPLNDLKVRQAVRYAIDHQALLDTCWAGRGTLIGSMVPPTDPWYEDLTGLYPFDLEQAKALVTETGVAATPLRLRVPSLPYATSCGQVVQSQLEQAGFKVNLDTLEFPAVWLSTVFTDADYDMSIVAHVEPRDLPAVFGNPEYYTRYDNKQLQADLAAADAGTPEEQVTLMKKAARELSQDAAADFLFLQPNLMVAEKGITGLPKNAITESFRLSDLSRG